MEGSRSQETVRLETVRHRMHQILRDYADALIIAVVVALLIRWLLLAAYRVPTDAMMPTLMPGDFVLGYKPPFGFKLPFTKQGRVGGGLPRRGAVVVFRCPGELSRHCVKRVIGLPGDRVEIRKQRLKVNGRFAKYKKASAKNGPTMAGLIVTEEVAGRAHAVHWSPRSPGHFPAVVVPPGHVYLLSDDRDQVEDSRKWGAVPWKTLEAELFFVWLSLDYRLGETRALDRGRGAFPAVRWERVFARIR